MKRYKLYNVTVQGQQKHITRYNQRWEGQSEDGIKSILEMLEADIDYNFEEIMKYKYYDSGDYHVIISEF